MAADDVMICHSYYPDMGERIFMSRKQKGDNVQSVMFSYVGTDHDFDEFLKMLLHDYLSADDPYIVSKQNFVDNVEFGVA